MNNIVLEACVETLEEAKKAAESGAHRIEYCANLEAGGLTPSEEDIDIVLKSVEIPVVVIIRPRAGNFEYSQEEFEQMKNEISSFKSKKILGFVIGITKEDDLDYQRIETLVKLCKPKEVCIHKAIDAIKDPVGAVSKLLAIKGIDRILTSGGAETAEEGVQSLLRMIKSSQEKIQVMPAGKITTSNLKDLHKVLNANTYHGRKIVND